MQQISAMIQLTCYQFTIICRSSQQKSRRGRACLLCVVNKYNAEDVRLKNSPVSAHLSRTLATAAHLPSERRAPRSQPPSMAFLHMRSSSPSMQAVMYRTSIVPMGSCATSSAVKQS